MSRTRAYRHCMDAKGIGSFSQVLITSRVSGRNSFLLIGLGGALLMRS